MAFGYVIGGGGGGSLDPVKQPMLGHPIYITEDNEAAAVPSNQEIDIISKSANKVNHTAYFKDVSGNKVEYNGSSDLHLENGVYYAAICGQAGKIEVSGGSSTKPVYFLDGKPVECDSTLANNISGVAASANKLNANSGSSNRPIYFSGGVPVQCDDTLANNISGNANTVSWTNKTSTSSNEVIYVGGRASNSTQAWFNTGVQINTKTNVLSGACWNDYAEYREAEGQIGQVVCESADAIMKLSTKRLQKGANIISDTYGFIIGKDSETAKPIAVSGRVLAFPDKDNLKIGDAVCSGKNGTVSRMNRLEIILFPDRIIGYVSEFPQYETWGPQNISTKDRIWIKVI